MVHLLTWISAGMVILFLIALFSEGVRMPDSNETELEEAKGKQEKVS